MVAFHLADIAEHSPFPDDYFDRVLSFSVWEHMAQPINALRDLYRILAPGGIAHILAALHAGTIGSHLHRKIYFPWPHLLFSDEVIGEWSVTQGGVPPRCSWVNTLTWSHYRLAIAELGFEVRALKTRSSTSASASASADTAGRTCTTTASWSSLPSRSASGNARRPRRRIHRGRLCAGMGC